MVAARGSDIVRALLEHARCECVREACVFVHGSGGGFGVVTFHGGALGTVLCAALGEGAVCREGACVVRSDITLARAAHEALHTADCAHSRRERCGCCACGPELLCCRAHLLRRLCCRLQCRHLLLKCPSHALHILGHALEFLWGKRELQRELWSKVVCERCVEEGTQTDSVLARASQGEVAWSGRGVGAAWGWVLGGVELFHAGGGA